MTRTKHPVFALDATTYYFDIELPGFMMLIMMMVTSQATDVVFFTS